MRIGGPITFNQSGAFPVSLGPGQYFYPPPGNYLLTLGYQSCLEWWDPIQYSWRVLAWPLSAVPVSIDGYNYRITNRSGIVAGAAITNAGTTGVNGIGPTQTGTTASFAAPGGTGQTAKGYVIIGGSLPALNIAQAGSAFVVPPLILIDPPPVGGIQATAISTITAAGALNSVTLVNVGAGYTSLPNVYVIPQFLDYAGAPALPYTLPATGPIAPNFPPGQIANGPGGGISPPGNFMQGLQAAFPITTGALVNFGAGVLGGSGTLTGLVVTDYGSAYTAVPAITFAGGTLAGGVAATALMSWGVTAVTGSGGVAYTSGNPVESTLGLFASPEGFYDNNAFNVRPMRGHLTSAAGATAIDDNGFGIQTVLGAGNFGVSIGGSIPTTTVTFSAITMGGVNDTSVLQAFLNE